jgi:hypothetical protein
MEASFFTATIYFGRKFVIRSFVQKLYINRFINKNMKNGDIIFISLKEFNLN